MVLSHSPYKWLLARVISSSMSHDVLNKTLSSSLLMEIDIQMTIDFITMIQSPWNSPITGWQSNKHWMHEAARIQIHRFVEKNNRLLANSFDKRRHNRTTL